MKKYVLHILCVVLICAGHINVSGEENQGQRFDFKVSSYY